MNSISNKKIGILGGGQLGKMLCSSSNQMHLDVSILDQSHDIPAAINNGRITEGSFKDFQDVYDFGKNLDYITIEIEHVNVEALEKLKQEGVSVHPSPEAIRVIQDKGLQKRHYFSHNIPTAPAVFASGKNEILTKINNDEIKYPFVQKLCKGGYDGKGVIVVKEDSEIDNIFDSPSVIEEKINIKKELAVIACRNSSGEVVLFPSVEMVFDEKANLVDRLISPAQISDSNLEEMNRLAKETIESFDICGLLAIEFFLTVDGKILVNEVAPRPHNSGHQTIEACSLSQFDMHWRGILNLPLHTPKLFKHAAMINIVGPEGVKGEVRYSGLDEMMKIEEVFIHIYGKKETKPFRKLGHYTILADSREELEKKIEASKGKIQVYSPS